MIDLMEVCARVDTRGTDLTPRRIQRTLEHVAALLDGSTVVAESDVQALPRRLKQWLEASHAPGATARNEKYRLTKLLKLAASQGLITSDSQRFQAGFPVLPRPEHAGPERRRHAALLAFEEWCCQRRLHLSVITTDTFSQYRNELLAMRVEKSTWREARYNDLIHVWTRLQSEGLVPVVRAPGWRDTSKTRYSLSRGSWPKPCQQDFERFVRAAANRSKPGERRWRGPLRAVSVKVMEKELRQLLGYLASVQLLSDKDDLLAVLTQADNVLGYIEWHVRERCGGKEHGYHRNTLDALANFLQWLGGEEDTCKIYRNAARSLRVVRSRDPFPERLITYEELTHAAQQALMESWKDLEDHSPLGGAERLSAACAVRDAMMFALLVCRPMRSRNLREMRLQHNLRRGSNGGWLLRFEDIEAKTRQYECAFPPVLMPWLEKYLSEVRPVLDPTGRSAVVFPTKTGKMFSANDLWKRVRAMGDRHLGMKTNPHQFRYLVPSAYLSKHPKALREMQALLGHSSTNMVLQRYIHVYSRQASVAVTAAIREHCPSLTRLGAFFPTTSQPAIP